MIVSGSNGALRHGTYRYAKTGPENGEGDQKEETFSMRMEACLCQWDPAGQRGQDQCILRKCDGIGP